VREVFAMQSTLAVLVVGEAAAGGDPVPARLLQHEDGHTREAALELDEAELAHLGTLPDVVWADDGGAHPPVRRVAGDAAIITNDLSPHMFSLAGLWGMPTREDATCLSRTFHDASVDGVLLSYGTHHIPDMFAAAHEAARTVRPGGTVVVHDFFDEGPAGQWFHRIVDKRSITGHDFPHIGPVQMAAVLLRAGLRDVRLYEIQDPFLFASDAAGDEARELALGYISGMYGLAPGFPDGLGEMEEAIHEILTYPEVGEVPLFAEGFVYIPRRAVVATATRPASAGAPYGAGDLFLVRRLAALFRRPAGDIAAELGLPEEVRGYWFAEDGRWWGITAEERAEWLAWADALERSAAAV
jgi:SAM-dependent methyltransferase